MVRFLTAVAVVGAVSFHGVAAEPEAGQKAVMTTVEIDRPVLLAGDGKPVYVLVRFKVAEVSPEAGKDRRPVNIALALDRSGSMADQGKIEYLKKAAMAVVERLGPKDRLAVVEYDDQVTVAWPSAPVEAPALIKKVIDDLTPRNMTDLTAGMMEGVAQVRKHLRADAVNRVFLLSDGLANRGVTNPREIRKLVRKAKTQGVPVTTLGLGLEYNEDLMQDIADNSGGNYHYIEGPSQMAGIFQRELSELFQIAARNVDFRFTPGRIVRDFQIFGYTTRNEGGATVVELPDFHTGETRSVVIRLALKEAGAGPLRLGDITFSYEDAEAGHRTHERRELSADVTNNPDTVRHAWNREAMIEAALVETEAGHEASLRLLAAGQWQQAERQLQSMAKGLSARNASLNDIRIAKKIEALRIESGAVAQAGAAPAAAQSMDFMKSSKLRIHRAMRGQRGLYLLQPGAKGHEVLKLQQALKAAGAYNKVMDGAYSADVENAVRSYQKRHKLAPDGIAGPETLNQLGLY